MSTYSFSIALALAGAIGCSIASAQSWCPPGARWVYQTGDPWIESKTSFHYAGDTVVDGQSAQRIDSEQLITQVFGTDTLILSSVPHAAITRHTADVVFLWNASAAAWDTLYWFGAQAGDSWRAPWAFGEECPPDHRFTVLETGTMEQDGVVLRKLHVQRTGSDPDGSYPAEWIAERIGTLEGYFFPIGHCGSVFECFCTLACYSDEVVGYQAAPNGCALPLGVPEGNGPGPFALWPNPGTGRVNYALPLAGAVDASVAYATGRTVLALRSLPAAGALELQLLRPGLYLVSFSTAAGYRATQRWQKVE